MILALISIKSAKFVSTSLITIHFLITQNTCSFDDQVLKLVAFL